MSRFIAAASLLFALSSFASEPVIHSAPSEFVRDAIGVKSYPAAPRLAATAALAPAVVLSPASAAVPEELVALQEWNAAGRLPLKNGFARPLADPVVVRFDGAVASSKSGPSPLSRGLVAATSRGTVVWSGAVRVEDADRVRLHLTSVELPDGAVLWVWGEGQEPIAFDKDILHEGSLYTPSVNGPTVHLEVEIPAGNSGSKPASFEIREVIEIVGNAPAPQPNDEPTCLIDATCVTGTTFSPIDLVRESVAQLQYVKGSGSYVCSGGLVNDKVAGTFVPYMLTANHCFDSQASASSLEAYFSYRTLSCSGAFPAFPTPALGATMLATNASTDFTFIRLNSVPGGRVFLGWTTAAVGAGTKLYRLSHPFPSEHYSVPLPQTYSDSTVTTTFGSCNGLPASSYLYSMGSQGGTYGGSSGAPVLLGDGAIVGQLYGKCGSSPSDGCNNASNAAVDGRFSVTFPAISQYINVTDQPQPNVCTKNATTLCLNNNRFKVQATYQTSGGQSGTASVVELTPDTGYFWFFNSSNVEAVVKVLNACGLNNSYWVFAGGLTDVRVELTLTDTKTGSMKTYVNPLGVKFAPIQDTSAFATCP